MQLTPRAKRVIDLAYEEARQLNNNYIGTEHLLLALLEQENGAEILTGLGISKEGTDEKLAAALAAIVADRKQA